MKIGALIGGALLTMVVWVPITQAAAPTLGGRLAPAELVFERQPWLEVRSLSTVQVAVELTLVGDASGWGLDADFFTLDPDQARRVAVTSAGPAQVTVRVTIRPTQTPTGNETGVLVLESKARHITFLEQNGSVLLLAALIAVLLLGFGIIIATRRRWAT